MNGRSILIAWLAVHALAGLTHARKWTDTNGNQVNAEYVRIHEGEVILRQGTRLLKCPYDQFCELDKAFIREQIDAERARDKRRAGINQISGPVATEETVGGARELRTWQDVRGKKVLAQYIDFSQGQVELLHDERRVSYSYAAFSPSDQAYVDRILIEEGREDEIPKKADTTDGSGGSSPPYEMGGGYSYSPPQYSSPEPEYSSSQPEYEAPSTPSYESPSYSHSPPTYSPPTDHTSAPDLMPDPEPFSSNSWTPQYTTVSICSACNKELPENIGAGDNCPHCHAYLSFEEHTDGSKEHASPWTWNNHSLVIRLGFVGFCILATLGGALLRR